MWYELSQDTLIRPILDDNRKRLQPWQLVRASGPRIGSARDS